MADQTPGLAAARRSHASLAIPVLLAALLLGNAPELPAQQATGENHADYHLPAGPLASVLRGFTQQGGIPVAASHQLLLGRHSPGLRGRFDPAVALRHLLAGTGLQAVRNPAGYWTIEAVPAGGGAAPPVTTAPVSPLPDATPPTAVPQLDTVLVQAGSLAGLAPAYAGGHVATGGNLGLLGNRDLLDTPFNTINYTSDYIEDMQGQELRILVDRTDPGIQTHGSGGTAGKDNLYIRGFAAGDVHFNGLQGITSGRRLMAIAERLEILKGPSTLLHGMNISGDVGGSINLIPKRAPREPLAHVTTSWLAPSQFGLHLDLGRRFGEQQQTGIRLNTVFRDGEGMVDHRINRDKLVALGLDHRAGRLRLSADLYHLQDYVTGVNRGIGLARALQRNPLPRPPRGDTLIGLPWAHALTRESTLVARAEAELSPTLRWHASVGSSRHDSRNINTKGSTLLDEAGNLRLRLTFRHNRSENLAASTGLMWSLQTGPLTHEISAGIDHAHQESRIDNTSVPARIWSETINIYNPVYPAPFDYPRAGLRPALHERFTSIGLADTLSLPERRLRLTVGLRHQSVRSHDDSGQASAYRSSALSPAMAASWRIGENGMLYGNYVEGLSAGEVVGDDYENAGEVFRPQRTRQIELGGKYDSGTWSASLSVFQITQPNPSETDPATPDARPRLNHDGRQRNRGLELNIVGQLTHDIRLTGGLAWLSPRITRASDPAIIGKYAVNLARQVFKAGLEWDAPMLPGLTLSAGMASVSRQYLDDENTYHAPGHSVFDLGARYQARLAGKPLTLRASVENVGDKAYWVAPLRQGQGAPRTWLLSATLRF